MSTLLIGAALVACASVSPGVGVGSLLGYEGLDRQVRVFYAQRAWERQASCPTPRIDRFVRADVLEENGDEIVALIRYSWIDESRADDDGLLMPGSGNRCRDIGERRFTLRRLDDGGVSVESMSGSQRQQPLGAVRI